MLLTSSSPDRASPAEALPRARDASGESQAPAIEYDQQHRYSKTAGLLKRMLAAVPKPVRILEVGCNVLNLYPRFLDPADFQVVRCDVQPAADDTDFVLIKPDEPLPFADDAFDAVAALEVLEHMPAGRRAWFLRDCLRVARHGAVFTCPNNAPEVREAEALASAAFAQRHGRPHPFLLEHETFGLPPAEEITAVFRELDYPHAVFDSEPLDVWLAMLLLSETLHERNAIQSLQQRLNQALERGLLAKQAVPYRRIYVCAKSFDATAALEPAADLAFPTTDGRHGQPLAAAPLNFLATMVCEALCSLEHDRRQELERKQEELGQLQNQLEAFESQLQSTQQHVHILESFLQMATGSWLWRIMEPLRWLRRFLRPRGCSQTHLIESQHLEVDADAPPGTWIATGPDPQFFVPICLPAGWIRIRVEMTSEVRGRQELLINRGAGFLDAECIERTDLQNEWVNDFYVYLRQGIMALRFDPLDRPGKFHLKRFEVTPLPLPVLLLHALGAKLRLLARYGLVGQALGNGLAMVRRGEFLRAGQKFFGGLSRPNLKVLSHYDVTDSYQIWRKRRQLTDDDRAAMHRAVAEMAAPPLLSIIMPVWNVQEKYLRLAIESVLRQTYPHWELCLVDDASTMAHIAPTLRAYARKDPRIKLICRPQRGGISAASNEALAQATGEYIALLDHDDELAEHALFAVAQAILADPDADFLYTDEDKIEANGRHVEPFFKPDWCPEYFQACMYTCHLGVYRSRLARAVGGFRSDFDFAQDYDLALRVVAESQRIRHIPDVLYHWRKIPTSTALRYQSKPLAYKRSRAALESYLQTIGLEAKVEPGPMPGFHRVRAVIKGRPKISIVIPSACKRGAIDDVETTLVEACIGSIQARSSYRNLEIIVIDNNDMPADLKKRLQGRDVKCLSFTAPFNLAAKMNLGAAAATGDHLLFLNDDITVITPDWLECLLEYSQNPEIGAVGAKLLFPSNDLQHVGVTILNGLPGHPFYRFPAKDLGYFCGNIVARNYSAVTGACLMTRAEVFRQINGFAEEFPLNFNDIDYCLRVRELGLRIVFNPYARLYHHEGVSKTGVHPSEAQAFKARWGSRYAQDPYYNPNLSNSSWDYRIDVAKPREPF